MGFPNVDKILVNIFLTAFTAAQDNIQTVVEDLFEYDEDQADIITYLLRLHVTKNVQEKARQASDRFLYIVPSFPLADIAGPQIGVYLGNEDGTGMVLGASFGEIQEVTDEDDTIIAYDDVKGYFATPDWQVDIVAPTKDECIWLSRMCQYAVFISLDDLEQKGITTVTCSLNDVKIADLQPQGMFVRTLKINARVKNTWKKRKPKPLPIHPGKNTALDA